MDDRRVEMVDGPAGPVEVYVQGEGPAVLMIPSLGRGAGDFDRLAVDLVSAGYRSLVPEPRDANTSGGRLGSSSQTAMASSTRPSAWRANRPPVAPCVGSSRSHGQPPNCVRR
jgi:hypothetical protein